MNYECGLDVSNVIWCDVCCETLHLCLCVVVRHLNLQKWIKSVCTMGSIMTHRSLNDFHEHVEEMLGCCPQWPQWHWQEQKNRAGFTYMASGQVDKVELRVILAVNMMLTSSHGKHLDGWVLQTRGGQQTGSLLLSRWSFLSAVVCCVSGYLTTTHEHRRASLTL